MLNRFSVPFEDFHFAVVGISKNAALCRTPLLQCERNGSCCCDKFTSLLQARFCLCSCRLGPRNLDTPGLPSNKKKKNSRSTRHQNSWDITSIFDVNWPFAHNEIVITTDIFEKKKKTKFGFNLWLGTKRDASETSVHWLVQNKRIGYLPSSAWRSSNSGTSLLLSVWLFISKIQNSVVFFGSRGLKHSESIVSWSEMITTCKWIHYFPNGFIIVACASAELEISTMRHQTPPNIAQQSVVFHPCDEWFRPRTPDRPTLWKFEAKRTFRQITDCGQSSPTLHHCWNLSHSSLFPLLPVFVDTESIFARTTSFCADVVLGGRSAVLLKSAGY